MSLHGMVLAERERQVELWGAQRQNPPEVWLKILTEEIGEISNAELSEDHSNTIVECVQSLAVIQTWLASLPYVAEPIYQCPVFNRPTPFSYVVSLLGLVGRQVDSGWEHTLAHHLHHLHEHLGEYTWGHIIADHATRRR